VPEEAKSDEGEPDRSPYARLADEFGEYHILQVVSEASRDTEDNVIKWSVERFYTKVYYLARKSQTEDEVRHQQELKMKRANGR
jgi:hypothetical protein